MRPGPYVLEETETYAVVYKPPRIHSAPLNNDPDSNTAHDTLLGWYAERCPAILIPRGKKSIEGGLLHRLDFETEGLVLFAKTQQSLESLNAQQAAGQFVKEYGAITCGTLALGQDPLPGFPPSPGIPEKGSYIESFFRPWGPGRKAVRPVVEKKNNREIVSDSGACYRTEILECEVVPDSGGGAPAPGEGLRIFKLRLLRGFRHQIRCHLAWIGEPILNDTLYGGAALQSTPRVAWPLAGPVALRAEAFSFYDPETREQKNYRLDSVKDILANFRGQIK
jgi:23S rRNA pseudouridine1911/1915/1917 synthase